MFYGLKLTEEEKLIKETAAQFVDKELIAREGAFLKQSEPFLAAGRAGAARARCGDAHPELLNGRASGSMEIGVAGSDGRSGHGAVAQVLIHREFGRTVLPFEPVTIPAFMFETKYGEAACRRRVTLALAFDEAHKTGSLSSCETLYRQEPEGAILQDSRIDLYTPRRRPVTISRA